MDQLSENTDAANGHNQIDVQVKVETLNTDVDNVSLLSFIHSQEHNNLLFIRTTDDNDGHVFIYKIEEEDDPFESIVEDQNITNDNITNHPETFELAVGMTANRKMVVTKSSRMYQQKSKHSPNYITTGLLDETPSVEYEEYNIKVDEPREDTMGEELNEDSDEPREDMMGEELNEDSDEPREDTMGEELNEDSDEPREDMMGEELNEDSDEPREDTMGEELNEDSDEPREDAVDKELNEVSEPSYVHMYDSLSRDETKWDRDSDDDENMESVEDKRGFPDELSIFSNMKNHEMWTSQEVAHVNENNIASKTKDQVFSNSCHYCEREFDTQTDLTNNSKSHTVLDKEIENVGDNITDSERNTQNNLKKYADRRKFRCDICKKQYNRVSESFISAHLKTHRLENRFHCSYCKTYFSNSCCLETHLRIHNGENVSNCDQCGDDLTNESSNLEHERKNDFKCTICIKKFITDSKLKVHFRIHTEVKRCRESDKNFAANSKLARHRKMHATEKAFACDICGKRYKNKQTLKDHIIKHMNSKYFDCTKCGNKVCLNGKSPLKCGNCGNRFFNNDDSNHRRHFICDVCNRPFICKSKLIDHFKTHSDEKPYSCNQCGKGYIHITSLMYHVRSHMTDKTFTCDVCDTIWKDKCEFIKHVVEHNVKKETKPFNCTICHKRFLKKTSLTKHMASHRKPDGKMPRFKFQCEVCSQNFESTFNYETHMKVHALERMFTCDTCNKNLPKKCCLITHFKIHDGEKQLKCEKCGNDLTDGSKSEKCKAKDIKCTICGRQLSSRSKLSVHLRTHTGEKPFSCPDCGHKFASKNGLKQHSRVHVTGKSFFCEICGKEYNYISSLNRHMRRHKTVK